MACPSFLFRIIRAAVPPEDLVSSGAQCPPAVPQGPPQNSFICTPSGRQLRVCSRRTGRSARKWDGWPL